MATRTKIPFILAIVFIVLSVTTSQASSRSVYANIPRRTGFGHRTSDSASVMDDTVTGSENMQGLTKREYTVFPMYLQRIADSKYLYVTASGDVAATQQCDKYGAFTYHKRADKSGYILNKETKKYLAIDNSGNLYTSDDGLIDDADLGMETVPNSPPRHVRIYRIQDNTGTKLYLSVSKPNQQNSIHDADIVNYKLSCS